MASTIAGYIGKINPGDGTNYSLGSTAYGVCGTAAGTAAKTVEMTGFKLVTGATIFIKFTNANTAASPTLNVQSTGAKPIVLYGTTAAGTTAETNGWQAGAVLCLTYDGTSWVRDQGYNTNTNTDTLVKQTAKTDDVNYKLLLTELASPTSGTAYEANYGANLIYNPSANKLSTGNIKLTGELDVTGNAYLKNETIADSLTAGSLLVNGAANFVQSPTGPTAAAGDSSTKLATTEFVTNSVAGLSGAMHFRGTTTTAIADGSTTNPITISGSSYTATAGDVVLREISTGNIFEYVWTGSAWEMLGRDTSFKITQNAVSSPTANGSTTAFIDTISQDTNGNITVTKKNLDTSGTWGGNAVTATTASKLSNISNIGDTNKPVYFTANGVPATINYTIDKSVPSTAVFTDRYVNSAIFTDDTANTSASPVKMTLTRVGSDTATVIANIPKVSSSSAGVAPKGTAVSTQSQTTKFLREDGTWAAPSYTATAEDEIYPVNVTLTSLTQGTSNKTHTEILAAVNAGKLPIVNTAYETTKMIASLTFVNSDKAVFTYENQMDNEKIYAAMEIVNNTVIISWKNQYIVATDLGDAAFDDIVPIEHGGTGNVDGYIRTGQKSGTTIGIGATAEGINTTASGEKSHAEGMNTTASHYNSHAEGMNTTASGHTSHAEGAGTIASFNVSHAEGAYSQANGAYSHAQGFYTLANKRSQHVFGEFNVADTQGTQQQDRGKYVEIVGNGTSLDARSNARTLDWNGNETLAGKLTVGANPVNNMDVTTKQYVQQYVSNFTDPYEDISEDYFEWKEIYYENTQIDNLDLIPTYLEYKYGNWGSVRYDYIHQESKKSYWIYTDSNNQNDVRYNIKILDGYDIDVDNPIIFIKIIEYSDDAYAYEYFVKVDRYYDPEDGIQSCAEATEITAGCFRGYLEGTAEKAKKAAITTTQNAIAKYSNTTGTFANSGVTIDSNNNIATSGDITTKGTYIFGTNTSNKTNRYISSDAANNIFAKINNTYALVITDAEVRRGSSASAMNLGTSSYPWKNIYGTNIYGNGSNLTSLNASNISSGTVAFARLPSMYWANTIVASTASYNTTPEVASIKIGNGTAAAAGEKGVTLQYDDTLEVLNFVFA